MPYSTTYCQLVLSWGIAAWEQHHIRKQNIPQPIVLSIYLQFFFLRTVPYVIYLCHNVHEQNLDSNLVKFRCNYIEVNKYIEAKKSPVICCVIASDGSHKISNICVNSTTYPWSLFSRILFIYPNSQSKS